MSSLDDIFVDDEPDEETLAELLKNRVSIVTEKKEIRPGEKFEELNADQQIVCSVAAVKAMELKGIRDSDEIGPRKLAKICPVPQGTIGSKIKEISVLENNEGKYRLPGYEFERAKKMVEDG